MNAIAASELSSAAPVLSELNDAQFNADSHADVGAVTDMVEELIRSWSYVVAVAIGGSVVLAVVSQRCCCGRWTTSAGSSLVGERRAADPIAGVPAGGPAANIVGRCCDRSVGGDLRGVGGRRRPPDRIACGRPGLREYPARGHHAVHGRSGPDPVVGATLRYFADRVKAFTTQRIGLTSPNGGSYR